MFAGLQAASSTAHLSVSRCHACNKLALDAVFPLCSPSAATSLCIPLTLRCINRYVEPILIAQKVITGVYPGVTTCELDELAAQTAAYQATQHRKTNKREGGGGTQRECTATGSLHVVVCQHSLCRALRRRRAPPAPSWIQQGKSQLTNALLYLGPPTKHCRRSGKAVHSG